MENATIQQITARVQKTYSNWTRKTTIEQMRQDWDDLYAADCSAAKITDVEVNGLTCRWVKDQQAGDDKVALYVHGGGFRMGSVNSHQALMAKISAAAGCKVFGVTYHLMPAQYPVQLNDLYAAYQWVLEQGYSTKQIAIIGDSAGGNLVAALINLLISKGETTPTAAVYLSAWFDMTASADSYESRAKFDPIHQKNMIQALAKGYLGDQVSPNDPLTSPIVADLTLAPPSLIQVGDHEVGLGDSIDYAAKLKASGVEVELEVWDNMIHVFQLFAPELAEANQAITKIGVFLKKHLTI